MTRLPDELLNVVNAFDWLINFGVIFQTIMFAVATLITAWMHLKRIAERSILVTYWINFFFFLSTTGFSSIACLCCNYL
jgi:hypothetical protein